MFLKCCTLNGWIRPVESGPIDWEEFEEAFLGKYFPCERREVNVEEFIYLK